MSQCVSGQRVVQLDRRKRELRDEEGVVKRFGVGLAVRDYESRALPLSYGGWR